MPAPSTYSNSTPAGGDIADLILQVQDLRQRVLNLENRLGITVAAPQIPVQATSLPPLVGVELPPNIVPVLGRMLVAIAGAYVLRALTEWGVLPAAAGVAIGLIYALIWLVVAARLPAGAKFAAALSCSTSVLIMAPLLWEATGRLKVLSSATSSEVLVTFALLPLAFGSRTRHRIIGTIAGLSSIAMAFVLLLARNDIVPFTTALLVIAAGMEFAGCRDRRPGARAFAAVAVDCSVILFSWLMASSHGMPETWIPVSPYAVLAAQLALTLIYIVTAVTQTVVRRRTLAFAEMAQTAAALLIGIGGAVWDFKDHHAITLGLGIVALAAGLACYAGSFCLFEHDNKWNFRAWATFGLFLVLAGIFLPFSRTGFWILSCMCAAACCWIARAFHLPTLGLHGAVYLLLGAAVAGATAQTLRVLFGASSGAGRMEWLTPAVVLLAATVCWAGIAELSRKGHGVWRNQISSLAIAAHIAWITIGFAVLAILRLWRTVPLDTLGTVILTSLSLVLGWAGIRWARPELVWLLYGLMALGAYKLVIRDFMNEHGFALVVSLLCYGSALIVLPRMLRSEGRSA